MAARPSDNDKKDTSALDTRTDAEVHFNGRASTDDGIKYHMRVELEGQNNAQQRLTDPIDEYFLSIAGSFGQIILGGTGGAPVKMLTGMSGSWATQVGRNLNFYSAEWTGSAGGSFYTLQHIRLDTGDAEKISYISPKLGGFQVGLTYSPGARNGDGDDNKRIDAEANRHDGYEAAVSYSGKFGDVGFGVGAGMTAYKGCNMLMARQHANTMTRATGSSPAVSISAAGSRRGRPQAGDRRQQGGPGQSHRCRRAVHPGREPVQPRRQPWRDEKLRRQPYRDDRQLRAGARPGREGLPQAGSGTTPRARRRRAACLPPMDGTLIAQDMPPRRCNEYSEYVAVREFGHGDRHRHHGELLADRRCSGTGTAGPGDTLEGRREPPFFFVRAPVPPVITPWLRTGTRMRKKAPDGAGKAVTDARRWLVPRYGAGAPTRDEGIFLAGFTVSSP